MVESLFTKPQIDAMRPHIQQTVDKLLETVIAEGGSKPFDIVEKFALPVPSYVTLTLCYTLSLQPTSSLTFRLLSSR